MHHIHHRDEKYSYCQPSQLRVCNSSRVVFHKFLYMLWLAFDKTKLFFSHLTTFLSHTPFGQSFGLFFLLLNQYFSLLVKFSFRVNSCNKWHHQNISRNLYILNIVLKLQNCISRTPWKWSTEHLASSRKIAESSTWSMEDFVFHPCLSTLARIMIF